MPVVVQGKVPKEVPRRSLIKNLLQRLLLFMGATSSTAIEDKAAADGYQLLEDTQIEEGNMDTENETAPTPEPPLYGEGETIKIDDAIEAIGMGK